MRIVLACLVVVARQKPQDAPKTSRKKRGE
jgi:hypothetical protein